MFVPEACPICGAKPDPKLRPFCSARCADVDLGRWFTGQYRVPAKPEEDEGNEAD
ncbi:DNA gyrase inhibitor YacG [Acidisphaera sp. L21]|uniref:DNA gyrase inhibitor YacG n=1 Tax=Acidisphaera sp. L21 TaxID=1641851 RepID=UPI00131BA4DF